MITGKFPNLRLRRSRKNKWSRRLIEENKLSANVYFIPYLINSSHDKKKILSNVKQILEKFVIIYQLIYSLIEFLF